MGVPECEVTECRYNSNKRCCNLFRSKKLRKECDVWDAEDGRDNRQRNANDDADNR